MQLSLSPTEVVALRELLESEIPELKTEIRHTDTSSYRDQLRAREQVLVHLLEQVRGE